MNKRGVTYVLVFFFSVSSLLFACPEVFSLSAYQHSAVGGSMPDADPCREMDHQAPHSICYSMLHDRLSFSATEFSPPRDPGAPRLAVDVLASTEPISLTRFSPSPSESPPKLALTILLHVLRI